MKYYLIAGEASGDLHASALMKELKKLDASVSFRFFGGELMLKEGGTLVKHYREMAFMGVVDVLANIGTISRNLKLCKSDLLSWSPDAVILVDSAGFNLRIAEFAKRNQFRVFYYIPPKVWAWKKSRLKKLRKFTDIVFPILPFEEEYFNSRGLNVEYLGNPLMDAVENFREDPAGLEGVEADRPVLAILAGSRIHEISRCLPEILKGTDEFTQFQRVIAGSRNIDLSFYQSLLAGRDVKIAENRTYALLSQAGLAVVTSGTATLETAIFKVPQVVVYKTNPLQYEIGRLVVNLRFFSLVNLIAGREVVKELLQKNLVRDIRNELSRIINQKDYKQKMLDGYMDILTKLGGAGSSARVAAKIVEAINIRK